MIVAKTTVVRTTIRREKKMIMRYFSVIGRGSYLFLERKLKKYEIGMPEQLIMMFLNKVESSNQDSIAKYFKIDKGSIAKTIAKMEKKGLLYREQNRNNRRENTITISEKGRSLGSDMESIMNEWNEGMFQGFSETEIIQFKKMLEQVAENVEELIQQEERKEI